MHSDRAVKRNLLAVTLLAGVLMAVAIPGAYAQMGTTVAESKAVHFLRTDTLDFAKILPAPPEPGSLAAGADLNAVLQVQAWRTPEEVAWAKRIEKIRSLADILHAPDPLGLARFLIDPKSEPIDVEKATLLAPIDEAFRKFKGSQQGPDPNA